MTVPVQRGGSQDDPTVTNLILSAIDDLKNGFVRLEERISARVEDQAKQFLPRGEYEARHSDVRNQITKLDGRVDAEVTRLESRLDAEATERKAQLEAQTKAREALEEKITQGQRWATQARWMAIGGVCAGLGALVALLTLLLH